MWAIADSTDKDRGTFSMVPYFFYTKYPSRRLSPTGDIL